MLRFKLFLIGLTSLLLASCATIGDTISQHIAKPDISYRSVAIGEISQNSIELRPTFSVLNSNAFPLPINSVSYQLFLNSDPLVAGDVANIGTIAANQAKDITLGLNLGRESLKTLQHTLFKDGQVEYLIKGAVNVMGLDIPFKQQATLYMPNVEFNQVNIVKGDFNQVDLILEFAVENRNDFDLPLDQLNYVISSGSTMLFNGTITGQQIDQGKQMMTLPLSFKPSLLFSNVFSLLRQPSLPLQIEINSPLFSTSHQTTISLSDILK